MYINMISVNNNFAENVPVTFWRGKCFKPPDFESSKDEICEIEIAKTKIEDNLDQCLVMVDFANKYFVLIVINPCH
jgi:hypothetical protein